jgi:hypothetical protein
LEISTTMLATIVDVHALWKILLAALVVGVGVTFLFGQGALAAERISQGRAVVLRDGAIIALAAVACIAALALGVVAMTSK